MSNQTNQPLTAREPFPPLPNSYCKNDEIDLKELFLALWQGKWIVIALTAICTILATVYAVKQPNVYQATATYVVNSDFGNMQDIRAPQLLSSVSFKQTLTNQANVSVDDISNVSISLAGGVVTISATSTDPVGVFNEVKLVSDYLNTTLKFRELKKSIPYADVTEEVGQDFGSNNIASEAFGAIVARQIYEKALLENAETQVIYAVNLPVKPTSHIKPKRALIVVLGTMLGGMLGVAIVLIRFAFRREEPVAE
ncbi:Wzz/FepE/Etk N-terminal domain-containing protein [Vibrio scophthalmi]|uniref:Wzz/FepE/Etk N-terminal domain-containing protein n=1 Tax=Vibrio scophthalmi TaxID=45658 RepID=UPI00387372E2